jgi:hypothetical protein
VSWSWSNTPVMVVASFRSGPLERGLLATLKVDFK